MQQNRIYNSSNKSLPISNNNINKQVGFMHILFIYNVYIFIIPLYAQL